MCVVVCVLPLLDLGGRAALVADDRVLGARLLGCSRATAALFSPPTTGRVAPAPPTPPHPPETRTHGQGSDN